LANAVSTIEKRGLKFIGWQTDFVRGSVTDFYIEPPNTPGPREGSNMFHLIARMRKAEVPIFQSWRVSGSLRLSSQTATEEQVIEILIGDVDPQVPASSARQ
jgi:hypothetical protein